MLNNSRCAGLDANHCIQIAQHCGERDLLAFYTNTRSVTLFMYAFMTGKLSGISRQLTNKPLRVARLGK